MKWNKLLERQIQKYLPEGLEGNEQLQLLFKAVNDSYAAYERDSVLAERAFKISEEEYIEVNRQLQAEVEVKQHSMNGLKNAIANMGEEVMTSPNQELPDLVAFLTAQISRRKNAEQQLFTAVNWLSFLISNMPMGILVEDENRQIVLTNSYFCDLFNMPISPEMLIGADCAGSAAQCSYLFADSAGFLNRVNTLMAERKLVVNEELLLADGRYLERDYVPIFIERVYKGHLWNYRDVTERRKSEQRLKASEELWQFALEGAGDGVWEYNFQSGEVFFSRQYKKMLGFEEDEFTNNAEEWRSRIHPADMFLIDEAEEAYFLKQTASHQREYRIRHKDGHYMWILDRGMVVSYTEDGEPCRIVGTHADITERKLAEQAIQIREEKYRNIIANMNLGLLEVDNNEQIQYANQRFCEMSGFTAMELTGKNASTLFASMEGQQMLRKKLEMRKKGVSDVYELAVKDKKGDMKWWLISGAPRYNDAGEMMGSIGIHLDITDQKKMQFELNEAREAAEQSSLAKEAFLANMSHEIRTPMNAIRGMGRLMQKTMLNEEQRLFLRTITTATDHLMVVINDVLDMSKIVAGKLELEHIGFNPAELLRHSLRIMQPRAAEKDLDLLLNIVPGIRPVLLGDPHRLNQVLLNLISNAIKFTDTGSVTVSCSLLRQDETKQVLVINVTDTGIGMEPAFLETLFEKFTQEDKSIARKYGGTGLGMAISRQLVELMNGNIEVFSEKGRGTEMRVMLAFETGTEQDIPVAVKVADNAEILKGKRILLVEDYEMNRLVATTLLKAYGVVLEEAVNGAEAVAMLKQKPYDLVLMDVQMPVMSGLQATAIIRQEMGLTVPVIALTASALKGESDRCIAMGMNAFVSKPFDEHELIGTMAGCLQHNGHPVQVAEVTEAGKTDTVPLYSFNYLVELSDGDEAFMQKITTLFIEQVPPAVVDIRSEFDKGNYAAVRAAAHKMKPSLYNLEIHSLIPVIRELERLPDQYADIERTASLVAKLETGMAAVVAGITK